MSDRESQRCVIVVILMILIKAILYVWTSLDHPAVDSCISNICVFPPLQGMALSLGDKINLSQKKTVS